MKSEKGKKSELFIWGILFAACVIIAFAQKLHDIADQKQANTVIEVTTQESIDSGSSTVDSEGEQITSEELKEDDTEEVPSGVIK